MTTYYDPYASANDPAYSAQTGPTDTAVIEQLRAMGYTDRQIAAYQAAQVQAAAASRATSSASGPTWSQQQGASQAAASLAEQQRQFNETFGYNKARGDQQMQLSQAQLALEEKKRIDALRGPQDYIRYWRASRGMDAGAPTAMAGAATAPAAAATSTLPAWASNVKVGTPAGAQTISDAPGGPAWAWSAPPSAGYSYGVQSVMPKSAVIATSGLPDQTKPVSLSDWAVKQMAAGGFKF